MYDIELSEPELAKCSDRRRGLETSQLNTESYARSLRLKNITPTPGGPETTVTEVLETEKVHNRSIFKTKLRYEGQKSQIMLAVPSLDQS